MQPTSKRETTHWTEADVPDLSGRTYVVTGANSGIGLEAARVMVRQGARVVLACRSLDKAERAASAVRIATGGGEAHTVALDLESPRSIRACAEAVMAGFGPLHGLVNNAGVMATPFALTEAGFELQIGTNHFGHYALTGLLLPALLAVPGARVVTVSSLAHASGQLDFSNLEYANGRRYERHRAYARSKLANLLFMRGLAARFSSHGVDALSLAAHPGMAQTNLLGPLKGEKWWVRAATPVVDAVLQSAERGALPTLRALLDPHAESGEYYGPDGYRQFWGHPVTVGSTRASRDPAAIERLWEVSERRTGVRYDWSTPRG